MVALALRLRELSQQVRVCVPPDFRDWIEGLGIPVTPIGPELRWTAKSSENARKALSSPQRRRELMAETVAAQFATIPAAAQDCDVLVGCGALQIAAPSVAQLLGIGYVHMRYCPITLPSPHHAPPRLPGQTWDEASDNAEKWRQDARQWDDNFGAALNAHRASAGLPPIADVRAHLLTDRPWLAADPTLGPWPEPNDPRVFQTGAWQLPDERPLSADLEDFLAAGEPPVYFGLGSIRAPGVDISRMMVDAARAVGRRVIISRGWADLPRPDEGPDCVLIGEANHQALFPRVAAVVHHGGAGTTTAVARAAAPQVVIPQMYDQPYWSGRVRQLGIGVAHQPGMPTVESLAAALDQALRPDVVSRARAVASMIRVDGAQLAAERLVADVGTPPS